jgi:hypothetical protein
MVVSFAEAGQIRVSPEITNGKRCVTWETDVLRLYT